MNFIITYLDFNNSQWLTIALAQTQGRGATQGKVEAERHQLFLHALERPFAG
jgi:hypothetical protein